MQTARRVPVLYPVRCNATIYNEPSMEVFPELRKTSSYIIASTIAGERCHSDEMRGIQGPPTTHHPAIIVTLMQHKITSPKVGRQRSLRGWDLSQGIAKVIRGRNMLERYSNRLVHLQFALCRRGARGRSGEEPLQCWWPVQHDLYIEPKLRPSLVTPFFPPYMEWTVKWWTCR